MTYKGIYIYSLLFPSFETGEQHVCAGWAAERTQCPVPAGGGVVSSWALQLSPPWGGAVVLVCNPVSSHVSLQPKCQTCGQWKAIPGYSTCSYDVYVLLQFQVCVCVCEMSAQELCLYTLGNLWPESAVVKDKLLVQGIVPALANCIQVNITDECVIHNYPSCDLSFFQTLLERQYSIYIPDFQNQRCNLAVMEAVGFTLSQLLQDTDAADKIIPWVTIKVKRVQLNNLN